MIETKDCVVCNRPIVPSTSLRDGTDQQRGNWARRKYCSASCRMKEWTRTGGMKWRKMDAARNPEKWLHYRKNLTYKRFYGITYDDYLKMNADQKGLCAICFQPETLMKQGVKFDLAIDHDHETGKIRGLLCNNCNRAIGMLKDDPMVLQSALDYLMRHHG